LELYLHQAEEPLTANKLFTEKEIRNFIDNQKMLPLEKLVILSGIMRRCLILSFTGKRTASMSLKTTENAEDFLGKLLDVYNVIALLGKDSAALEPVDTKTKLTLATKTTRLTVTENASEIAYMASEPSELKGAKPELVQDAMDLGSLDALVTAAHYRGFTVRISMQQLKAA
jgi:hypothetical protein